MLINISCIQHGSTVKNRQETRDHRQGVCAELFAEQIRDGIGHMVKRKNHDGKLQCHAGGNLNRQILHHARDGQPKGKIGQQKPENGGHPRPDAQGIDLCGIIVRCGHNRQLVPQIFILFGHHSCVGDERYVTSQPQDNACQPRGEEFAERSG